MNIRELLKLSPTSTVEASRDILGRGVLLDMRLRFKISEEDMIELGNHSSFAIVMEGLRSPDGVAYLLNALLDEMLKSARNLNNLSELRGIRQPPNLASVDAADKITMTIRDQERLIPGVVRKRRRFIDTPVNPGSLDDAPQSETIDNEPAQQDGTDESEVSNTTD